MNTEAQLSSLYKELTVGGSKPVIKPYGSVVTLKDGTTVIWRPTSKSGGATIEVNYQKSLGDNQTFKIHVNH